MTAAVRFVVALLALLAPLALVAAMLSLAEWAGADEGHAPDLQTFIQANDLENVVHLLETHDVRPAYGDLYYAVPRRQDWRQDFHWDILATLIAAGARVDETDGEGRTALIRAIHAGSTVAVRILIDAGANVNARDYAWVIPVGKNRPEGVDYTALRWNASLNHCGLGNCQPTGTYIRIRDMLLAAGAHWGTKCLGRAVVNPVWFAKAGGCRNCVRYSPPCLCPSPNVGSGNNCERGDTPAECEKLGGDLQAAGGEADRICSGVDWNDTFCILGSVDAFPCAYFFAHVKECNALNRPALDPWHCGPVCPNRGFACGAKCGVECKAD